MLRRQQVAYAQGRGLSSRRACALLSVRARLLLYSMGVCGVEVSKLVKIFDSMRLELRTMVPAADRMAA